MSTGKGVDISIGGASISAQAGAAVVTALQEATQSTAELISKALGEVSDEARRRALEKRHNEIAALQAELATGVRQKQEIHEKIEKWGLTARCKSLQDRLSTLQRRSASDHVAPPLETDTHSTNPETSQAELKTRIEQLQAQLAEQEDNMRRAVTAALESHLASQGAINAIDHLASLPPPSGEQPAALADYLRQVRASTRQRRNAQVLTELDRNVQTALAGLPDDIPRSESEALSGLVADFARAKDAANAQVVHRRIMEIISLTMEAESIRKPLRARLARARALAGELFFNTLPDQDLQLLADDEACPNEAELARIEARIANARVRDTARISDQQRRLAMAATLDTLQGLGYETSVVDEATWFRNGSMFISRPEWRDYVVRVTPQSNGKFVMYAARYVEDSRLADAEKPLTPEMERKYNTLISDWCDIHLPKLQQELERRNMKVSISELESDIHAIQPVAREEVGADMARHIESRSEDQAVSAASRAKSRRI